MIAHQQWLQQYFQQYSNLLTHIQLNLMQPLVVLLLTLVSVSGQQYYNWESSSLHNATWMSNLNDGIPLRQLSIIGSHSSMGQGTWGHAFMTQSNTLTNQMMIGMRALDIRCRHKDDSLFVHDRLVYLNANLQDVLNTVRSFLQSYPSEVILVHIVEQYTASGNSGTFEDAYLSYQSLFMDIIWTPTTQNPTLGETRGKAVIIQDFPGAGIHGLLYSTFSVLGHKWFNTNWDQYDKWTDVKNFIQNANGDGKSRISFWTGHGGSFPYFVASGKSSPGNNHPRLATGLTTPGFKNYYVDFPRVACFIGICTIAFEGINKLAYDYIIGQGISYLGIVFTDFIGEVVLTKSIQMNDQRFPPCPATQITQGCTYCSSTGQCSGCNITGNYIHFAGNLTCGAKDGYYLDWLTPTSNVPELCETAMAGCLKCVSNVSCTECDVIGNYELVGSSCGAAPGYYLDNMSFPVVCTLNGCYRCLSDVVCQECSSVNNYIMNNSTQLCECDTASLFQAHPSVQACICMPGYFISPNNTCELIPACPANNSGCLICSSGVCSQCDTANNFVTDSSNPSLCSCSAGYFYDGMMCMSCATSLSEGCTSCASESLCLGCLTNFTLFNGDCQCLPTYYLDNATTCLSCQIGCLRCTDGSSCTICDTDNNFTLSATICVCNQGMFLNGTTCQVCGSMAGCLDCNTDGCIQCDPIFGFILNTTLGQCQCAYGQFINSMALCQKCTTIGCLDCTSQSVCTQCNPYFSLQNDVCEQICGDGVLFTLECDDNNTMSGDGCSQLCQVEQDYTCVGGTSTTPSGCSYSGPLDITIISVIKDPQSNTVSIEAKIEPALSSLGDLDFNSVWTPNFPVSSTNTSYDPTTGQILQVFTYDQSLNDRVLSVDFTPPATPEFFYMRASTNNLPATTSNNLALKVYSQEEYALAEKLQIVVWVLAVASLLAFLLAVVFVSKLMGLEMIFIFQMGYVGLMMVTKMETSMAPLKHLKIVSGWSGFISDSSANNLPSRLSELYLNAFFFANFMIGVLIVMIPLIIGAILSVMGKVKNNERWKLNGKKILKEWVLLALLFGQLLLAVSLSLSMSYDDQKYMGLVLGGLIYVGIIVYLVLLGCSPSNFGQFKSFFKEGKLNKNWYILVILTRTVIGFGIAAMWENTFICYIVLALAGVWLIGGVIVRPYESNLRPIVNSIFVMGIVGIYLYSNENRNSSDVTFLTTYMPVFLIAWLFAALVFNIICIIVYKCTSTEQKNKLDDDTINENKEVEKEVEKEYFDQLKNSLVNKISVMKETNQLVRQSQVSPKRSLLDVLNVKQPECYLELGQISERLPEEAFEDGQGSEDPIA